VKANFLKATTPLLKGRFTLKKATSFLKKGKPDFLKESIHFLISIPHFLKVRIYCSPDEQDFDKLIRDLR
jgi:hypothetical protein